MSRRRRRRLFPVALYATLLAALCCVAAPRLPRALQSWLQAALCLPLRAWSNVGTAPAADDEVQQRAASWVDALHRRLERAALAGASGLVPAGLEPVLCRVIERTDPGAARLPSVLWLDRSEEELADCLGFVTIGDHLLGFLAPSGTALAHERDGGGEAPAPRSARVDLLHGDRGGSPRRVPAVIDLGGQALRFVVEPASRIDEWPLRCRLFERPYEAAQLRYSGESVWTASLEDDPLGPVPAGLRIGELQVWGYPGEPPIGLFVRPHLDPRAISVVVAWRQRRDLAPALLSRAPVAEMRPVRRLRVPSPPPAAERWVLTTAARQLPVGAALSRGAVILGLVEQSGPGFALATPLGGSRRPWSLILVPDAPDAAPIPLVARGAALARGGAVEMAVESAAARPVPGVLFTGANGAHCPMGLVVGRAEPRGADGASLAVWPLPAGDGGLSVSVGMERAQR